MRLITDKIHANGKHYKNTNVTVTLVDEGEDELRAIKIQDNVYKGAVYFHTSEAVNQLIKELERLKELL